MMKSLKLFNETADEANEAGWPRAAAISGSPHEGFDTLGGADEIDHGEYADHEQHRLQDMALRLAESEQDRESPAAGERCAEHFRADQDRSRNDGYDAGPDDLACGGRC